MYKVGLISQMNAESKKGGKDMGLLNHSHTFRMAIIPFVALVIAHVVTTSAFASKGVFSMVKMIQETARIAIELPGFAGTFVLPEA